MRSSNLRLARDGSRILQRLSGEQRKAIINKMASNLIEHSKDILQANKRDLEEATKEGRQSWGHKRVYRLFRFRSEGISLRSTWFIGEKTENTSHWSSTDCGKG